MVSGLREPVTLNPEPLTPHVKRFISNPKTPDTQLQRFVKELRRPCRAPLPSACVGSTGVGLWACGCRGWNVLCITGKDVLKTVHPKPPDIPRPLNPKPRTRNYGLRRCEVNRPWAAPPLWAFVVVQTLGLCPGCFKTCSAAHVQHDNVTAN